MRRVSDDARVGSQDGLSHTYFLCSCTLFFIALSSALSVAFLSVSSNFIPAALIDVHKDTLDLSHLRGKEQVGFWFQLSVLLRRHLRSMSRDMVGFDLRYWS